VVEVREKRTPQEEQQKDPYDLNNRLKILCFIKERENRGIETYGATIKRGLGINEDVYKHLGPLEKDGKIVRYEINKKKFVKLTRCGEETIRKCFFKLFPSYETDPLLKKFVEYLSSKTEPFLKERHSGLTYVPDKSLYSLSEELRELYENKLREFCRNAKNLQIEVNLNDN
jgi:hypothetical protein